MNVEEVVDSVEYYMDELVDSFEDFFKKSLILITVALGSVVVMAVYVLKNLVSSHFTFNNAMAGNTMIRSREIRLPNDPAVSQVKKERSRSKCSYACSAEEPCRSSSKCAKRVTSRTSVDETIIGEVGLSNSLKPCNTCKPGILRTLSGIRTVISSKSLPECTPKHHVSVSRPCAKFMENRTSCCSMCCFDGDRR